jgi:hypothetical protein
MRYPQPTFLTGREKKTYSTIICFIGLLYDKTDNYLQRAEMNMGKNSPLYACRFGTSQVTN